MARIRHLNARSNPLLGAAYQATDADLTAIAALAPANDDVVQRKAGAWTNRTPAQLKTDLALVKGDVGLGSVDNTSDAAKPISTATQTALNAKQTLIVVTAYAPGTPTNFSTTSTTPVDCDATNLAVSFTAPTSGRVLVKLTGFAQINVVAASYYWDLREDTTTVAVNQFMYGGSTGEIRSLTACFVITGLTPGSAHTYKWAHHVDSGVTGRFDANTNAPAVMEVVPL